MTQRPRGDSQKKILEFIQAEIEAKGYPPSVREIAEGVGLKSTSTVHGHLQRLERKGLIRRDPLKPRALEVMADPVSGKGSSLNNSTIQVPIVGHVTAGLPILAEENCDDYVTLPEILLGEGEHFVLKVHGDSMVNIGILDGDYIIVRSQPYANNGEIVVAMMDDSATVKRYYRENGHFRLQPENPSMQPIIVDEVTILGKVISLYRTVH